MAYCHHTRTRTRKHFLHHSSSSSLSIFCHPISSPKTSNLASYTLNYKDFLFGEKTSHFFKYKFGDGSYAKSRGEALSKIAQPLMILNESKVMRKQRFHRSVRATGARKIVNFVVSRKVNRLDFPLRGEKSLKKLVKLNLGTDIEVICVAILMYVQGLFMEIRFDVETVRKARMDLHYAKKRSSLLCCRFRIRFCRPSILLVCRSTPTLELLYSLTRT
jgi:hypothetical protein